MEHQTFYRKYRSQSFEELVGQDHIKQTLSNAITHNRVSHAYIFSGPRGTGKTSTARILAKSLNCRKGPSVSPCQTCDLCTSITRGHSVDVIEIDAASNTGVDNIRDLNDRIHFQPVECKTKLYIIDEVHMLSTGAFNALLKTLEEPPLDTLFILATTEPHKIPATIHSRCQHLYFRNLTYAELVQQLQHIATKENITIDSAGLYLIARNSGGCMRDAISLFNQVYSFRGTTITSEDIQFMLGSTHDDALFSLLNSLFLREQDNVLKKLHDIFNQGAHATQLITDILTVLRQVIYTKLSLNDQLDGDSTRYPQYEVLAKLQSLPFLNDALQLIAQTELDLRWFSKPDLLIQIRCLDLMNKGVQQQHVQTSPQSQPTNPQLQKQAPVTFSKPTQATQPYQKPQPMLKPTLKPLTQAPKTAPVTQTIEQESTTTRTEPNDPSLQGYRKQWEPVLDMIKKQKTALYSILKQSHISAVNGQVVTIKLKQDFKFFRDKLMETGNKTFIETCFKEKTGQPCTLTLYGLETTSAFTSQTQTDKTPVEKPKDMTESQKLNHIVSMFEGTIL